MHKVIKTPPRNVVFHVSFNLVLCVVTEVAKFFPSVSSPGLLPAHMSLLTQTLRRVFERDEVESSGSDAGGDDHCSDRRWFWSDR